MLFRGGKTRRRKKNPAFGRLFIYLFFVLIFFFPPFFSSLPLTPPTRDGLVITTRAAAAVAVRVFLAVKTDGGANTGTRPTRKIHGWPRRVREVARTRAVYRCIHVIYAADALAG